MITPSSSTPTSPRAGDNVFVCGHIIGGECLATFFYVPAFATYIDEAGQVSRAQWLILCEHCDRTFSDHPEQALEACIVWCEEAASMFVDQPLN